MFGLRKLLKKPKAFHSLTGLTPEKFMKLAKQVEPWRKQSEIDRKTRDTRKRNIGAGRKYKLSPEESLFLLLLHCRTYVNRIFLGMIGNISDSKICQYFVRLEPSVQKVFRIPERKINLSQEEVLEIILDATEQETERRKGSGYSGKKKRQTVKTQIVVKKKGGKVLSVSKTVRGNRSDKKLYDQTRIIFSKKTEKLADLGYPGTDCVIPHKSSKLHKLTEEQKRNNKKHAKARIGVEHVFAHLKKFRILKDRYRNAIGRYNLIFKNICGLRNFILA